LTSTDANGANVFVAVANPRLRCAIDDTGTPNASVWATLGSRWRRQQIRQKVTNADAPQLSLPTANAAILSQGLVGSRSMRALRGNSSLDEYPISPLLAAIALGGCATPYQSAGAIGGYSDRKIDDQTYHVQFWGNGYTTGDKVHKYFVYRCAELTRQAGFKYFMIIPTTWSGSVAPENGPVSGSGFGQRMMRKVTSVPVIIYGGGGVTRRTDSADIRFFNDDAVINSRVVGWDADEVVDQLGPYVQSGGQTPAELPMGWIFTPGQAKVRGQDLLPTSPKHNNGAPT
jgi:hypothetical protein